MDCCDHQWIHACAWGDLDPQTTGGAVAPCPLSRGVTVAAVLCPGTSRSQRGLPSPPVLPLRLQEEPGSGVPHQCSGSKGASDDAGLPLASVLEPEAEADSDRAGWYNRASHRDTGRWKLGRDLSLSGACSQRTVKFQINSPESINS